MTNQGKNGIDIILAESIKELSKTRPIEKITIKEITDKAGVIRPTFYNHFQDKYELLEWIIREELMMPAMPLFNNGMTKEGITFIFTAIEKEKEFYQKAIRLEGQNSFPDMMMRAAQEIVLNRMDQEAVKKRAKYDWLTPELVAEFYGHMACVVAVRWIDSGMQIPVKELVDVYISITQASMAENIR